mmetsp:Transcript_73158/g.174347  ORF Transcript_73158/g.174347 Transcript_73158/m.174347 type:complete len:225 (+) Transcript_73158:372-1046(+)
MWLPRSILVPTTEPQQASPHTETNTECLVSHNDVDANGHEGAPAVRICTLITQTENTDVDVEQGDGEGKGYEGHQHTHHIVVIGWGDAWACVVTSQIWNIHLTQETHSERQHDRLEASVHPKSVVGMCCAEKVEDNNNAEGTSLKHCLHNGQSLEAKVVISSDLVEQHHPSDEYHTRYHYPPWQAGANLCPIDEKLRENNTCGQYVAQCENVVCIPVVMPEQSF